MGMSGKGACGGVAVEIELHAFGFASGRKDAAKLFKDLAGEIYIEYLPGVLVAKVGVRDEIRAKTGGFALVVYRSDETAGDKRFKAIVNRGERDRRHVFTAAGIDLVRRRVVTFVQKHSKDVFALLRRPHAMAGKSIFERFFGDVRKDDHWDALILIGIIPIRNSLGAIRKHFSENRTKSSFFGDWRPKSWSGGLGLQICHFQTGEIVMRI